jgi:hypothetical protein
MGYKLSDKFLTKIKAGKVTFAALPAGRRYINE